MWPTDPQKTLCENAGLSCVWLMIVLEMDGLVGARSVFWCQFVAGAAAFIAIILPLHFALRITTRPHQCIIAS